MSGLREKAADFLLGVRLVFGDRHTPWGRLALMAVGIGIGTALLLVGVTAPGAVTAESHREDARRMVSADDAVPGPVALRGNYTQEYFYDQSITGTELKPVRPDPPLPPGVDRMPAPGELVVSPELRRILTGPGAEPLRERLDGRIVGTIGPEGLLGERELAYYTGTDAPDDELYYVVHRHFGEERSASPSEQASFWSLLALGMCAALLPVVVFVLSTARLAEAARLRRLAALRLIGADARQLRRIAVGENLVSAVLGLPLGWAGFLLLRQAALLSPMNQIFQPADLTPVWWHTALVTLAVPVVVAVIAALALRRTIVDPLGAVHGRRTRRRRVWWRLVPPAAGVLGLLGWRALHGEVLTSTVQNLSIVLLLVGVPLLLPWLLEVVGSTRGGPVAWHLALRRLNFTSGAAARSVSAIAVVIAGAVSVQTYLAIGLNDDSGPREQHGLRVSGIGLEADPGGAAAVADEVSALPGVRSVRLAEYFGFGVDDRNSWSGYVLDCATIVRETGAQHCRDGDVFRLPGGSRPRADGPGAGAEVHLHPGAGDLASGPLWHVPPARPLTGPVPQQVEDAQLLLTPGAATEVPPSARYANLEVLAAPDAPRELIEQVRAISHAHLDDSVTTRTDVGAEQLYEQPMIRYGGLLAGLIVVLLVGSSLVVNAVEQIQESARPLAVLGAVGAPRTTVMWSVFLQNAVPLGLALVLAVPCGVVLGTIVFAPSRLEMVTVDLPGLGLIAGVVAVLALVVTALTAPTVSRALHPEGLRTG